VTCCLVLWLFAPFLIVHVTAGSSRIFMCNTVGNSIGLEVEGIYRVSGMKSKVEALKESYEQGM